jgi:hypothetical protein
VAENSCPKCQLPKDDGAWQCDGCGYEFDQNIEAVRSRLLRQVDRTRRAVWIALLVDVVLVGGVVVLAMNGFYYISVPLALTVIGTIGSALHRRTVAREHLSSFKRRHAELPVATARS